MTHKLLCGFLIFGLGACTTIRPPPLSATPDCVRQFESQDAAVRAAGVRDGSSHPVAGFPYLRVNRFLASFIPDLRPVQRRGWLQHARALDREARQGELLRLGREAELQEIAAELDACAEQAMELDLAQPARWLRLRQQASVPDDYSLIARSFGLYPLAAPFLAAGIQEFRAEVRREHTRPLADLEVEGELRLWQMEFANEGLPPLPDDAEGWTSDALGVPQISAAGWQALFARYAPAFLVDTRDDFDLPGRPGRDSSGRLDFMPLPSVYLHRSYTRFYGQVLPQLVYVVWFSERPPETALDSYAGALDAVMWRVTLDARAQPLVYDTVHACGCYHFVYPATQLRTRPQQAWRETALQPQGVVPWNRLAIWLASGTHYVRQVLPLSLAHDRVQRAEVPLQALDYRALSQLTLDNGQTTSLFGPDGLVAGTERLERFWLWPSGVRSPGAMRQWGRHATAFLGRVHFDDAQVLETWFLPRD